MSRRRSGSVLVSETAAGERLDRFLAEALDVPRNQIQRWIDDGRVRVDGGTSKSSYALRVGETIAWEEPEPPPLRIDPEPGELVVLHEDADLVVVDKPPGLAVHPGAGRPTGTLVHRLLAHYPEIAGVGGPGRPGIVHRLDMDTSGVMVLARTDLAYRHLSRAFAGRRVEKEYVGLAYGPPPDDRWTTDAPIARHPGDRTRMAVREGGRRAVSHFKVRESLGPLLRLEVAIETGRTHQIRVHAKHAGVPLLGDPVYGEARWKGLPRPLQAVVRPFDRPALHAHRLGFVHPTTAESVAFEAPLAADLVGLWREIRARMG